MSTSRLPQARAKGATPSSTQGNNQQQLRVARNTTTTNTNQQRDWVDEDLPLNPRKPIPPNLFPPLDAGSSNAVPDSLWTSQNFLLGAGLVIIQPSSGKVVIIYEKNKKYWFLPRGRKDRGESLEGAALREGYEESGYQAQFFPLDIPSRQPRAPGAPIVRENTEPIYVSITYSSKTSPCVEYLTFWYIGKIEADAVHHEGTGMADEQNFESFLVTFDEAEQRLWGQEVNIVRYARNIYQASLNRAARHAADARDQV